jgi:hypothetical protein
VLVAVKLLGANVVAVAPLMLLPFSRHWYEAVPVPPFTEEVNAVGTVL